MMLAMAACTRDTPEEQLRVQLSALQQAVEEGNARDAMNAVAEDFGGPQGMDRAALHNLLRAQVLAGRRVGITTTPYRITVNGDSATVKFDAVVTASGQGQWLPENARGFAVSLGWRREGDAWRLHHADWQDSR